LGTRGYRRLARQLVRLRPALRDLLKAKAEVRALIIRFLESELRRAENDSTLSHHRYIQTVDLKPGPENAILKK
jgi:hypothetical protein